MHLLIFRRLVAKTEKKRVRKLKKKRKEKQSFSLGFLFSRPDEPGRCRRIITSVQITRGLREI